MMYVPHEEEERSQLNWKHLALPWQACLEEAWTAYCLGSLPIGAVITDAQGTILARGRNRIFEGPTQGSFISGHRLAHAEVNALLSAPWQDVNPQTCILYTTTEPCPLCVGAIRMNLIGEVRYASRDELAGSAVLFTATPFLQKKNITVMGPQHADLENILRAMQVARGCSIYANLPSWADYLATSPLAGIQLGQHLFATEQLQQWRDEGRSISFVFDQLLHLLRQVPTLPTKDADA
jgi:tRNA(Arg) A34 adenosine deaminase TadA